MADEFCTTFIILFNFIDDEFALNKMTITLSSIALQAVRGIPITYLINLNSFFQGHYHEEVQSGVTNTHKFYQGLHLIKSILFDCLLISGYPGQPEIESSHFIEQSPGLGHPFLPGADSDFDVDHFLWTGDIDSEEENLEVTDEEFVEGEDGFRVTSKIYPNIPVIRPTSVLVTRYHS